MESSDELESSANQGRSTPEVVAESDTSPPHGNPFPIVGIGASAGGLEAFSQLLSVVRPNTGMAFVLVRHLDPRHANMLTDLLGSGLSGKHQAPAVGRGPNWFSWTFPFKAK